MSIINPYRFAAAAAGGSNYIVISNPSSGSIVTDGDYKYLTFTGAGTFDVDSLGDVSGSNSIEVLIVAGGGGGGAGTYSGGGGAGGVNRVAAWQPSTTGEHTAEVGAGGPEGTNGEYSRLEYDGTEESGTLADGGGYGNKYTSAAGANPGADGGSGGGGSSHIEPSYYVSPNWYNWMDCSAGGSATGNGAGNDGGKGYGNYGGVGYSGGGGGGAGTGGTVCDALYNSSTRVCGAVRMYSSYRWALHQSGDGGDGLAFTQFSPADNSSSDDYYGGGGGGATAYVDGGNYTGNQGAGGTGGGGEGAADAYEDGEDGTDYTGSGGGGKAETSGAYYGGTGGGGVIILRWKWDN